MPGKYLCLITSLLCLMVGAAQKPQDKLKVITVNTLMPIVERDGSILQIKSSYSVAHYNDIMCFQYFINFDSIVNGQLMVQEKRPAFFIFHKDSLFGCNYYPYFRPENRSRKDSMLKTIRLGMERFDGLLELRPDSQYLNLDSTITEVYIEDRETNPIYNFRVYLTFNSRFNDVQESLSFRFDSDRKIKLTTIRIKFDKAYSDEFKITFPEREIVSELVKGTTTQNYEMIKQYMRKYEAYLKQ